MPERSDFTSSSLKLASFKLQRSLQPPTVLGLRERQNKLKRGMPKLIRSSAQKELPFQR